MRDPVKRNYINLWRKMKGQSKVPINLGLLDFKKEMDEEIIDINYRMLKKIGWFGDIPDGLK